MINKCKIKKVLIANRGEIARRINLAAKKLGIKSVGIVSEPDKGAWFTKEMDEVAFIGAAPVKDSYLNIEKIIIAAKQYGCDAVHPGYGFLSENAEFCDAVTKAGLIFVGPPARVIEAFGSKTEARLRVQQFGVPVVPGTLGGLSDEDIINQSLSVGFPVLIKAAAGGGGRGMRVANNITELKNELPRARGEALKFFSSQEVFIERYVENPRHVEVQIVASRSGEILHLGTRDCSTQRRHQKLVEEAPAPMLSEELREKIHKAAISAAKSVNYESVGTVEFFVAGEEFFFLEMNTRIQVEHPVTELITGIDLVALQFMIAEGNNLGFKQEDVNFKGHVIEFRINGEDPFNKFSPATGRIDTLDVPEYEFLREDRGFQENETITPYYDALITKIIVWGPDREKCINRSTHVLSKTKVEGINTTVPFHRWLVGESGFRDKPLSISFIDKDFDAVSLKKYL